MERWEHRRRPSISLPENVTKWAHPGDGAAQETRVPTPSSDGGWNGSSPPRDGRRGCEAGAPTHA
eukprot:scaffold625_cov324-Pavlova_lutheri.AAC.114